MHTNRLSVYQIGIMVYINSHNMVRGVDLTQGIGFNPGSYKILHRMEEDQILKSKNSKPWGRYYKLTAKGSRLLKEVRKELKLLL